MATLKQKQTAKEIINNMRRNKPMPAGRMLENIGYSEAIAKNPKYVLESKGVKEELAKLGFTEENAKKIVAEILGAEFPINKITAADKLRAAELIFKVVGSFAPEKVEQKKVVAHIHFNRPVDGVPHN